MPIPHLLISDFNWKSSFTLWRRKWSQ